tara:strand:- start:207 stop:770 length:564 start_codon:yes stop_codon:yes gene_type:complete
MSTTSAQTQEEDNASSYGLGELWGSVIDTTTYITQVQGEKLSGQLHTNFEEWFKTGDLTAYKASLAEDVRYIRPGDEIDITGKDAAANAQRDLLSILTDVRFSVENVTVDGILITSAGNVVGNFIGTQTQIVVPYEQIIMVNVLDDTVVAIVDNIDISSLSAQIDALLGKTAVEEASWGRIKFDFTD